MGYGRTEIQIQIIIMIEVPINIGLTIYLSVCTLGLLILWFISGREGEYKGFSMFEDVYTWHCSICAYMYIDSVHNVISVCPRCASYNKRTEVKRKA